MKIYDSNTKELVEIADDQVSQALSSGTHGVDISQKYVVKDQENNTFEVEGSNLTNVLNQGYTFMTPNQQEIRGYVNDNKGIKGNAKVFAGQALDELFLGVPELAYDLSDNGSLEKAKKDALKNDHALANTLGGLTGFGVSIAGTGGLVLPARALAKSASKAGTIAAKVIAQRMASKGTATLATESAAKGLAKQLVEKGTKFGVEGAVWSLPQAATEASLGDSGLAAETMLYSIGFGSALGMTGALTNATAKGFSRNILQPISNKVEDIARTKLMRSITENELAYRNATTGDVRAKLLDTRIDLLNKQQKAMGLPNLEEKEVLNVWNSVFKGVKKGDDLAPIFESLSPEKAELLLNKFDSVLNVAKNFVARSAEAVGTVKGGAMGGGIGALVGQNLGKKASNYLDRLGKVSTVDGILFAEKQMKVAAKKLDSIGASITAPLKDKASVGFVSSRVAQDKAKTKKERLEEFNKIADQVAELSNNQAQLSTKLSPITNTLQVTGASNIASEFEMANKRAIDFLQVAMPKNPRSNLVFKSKVKWEPSDVELNTFERKYRAVLDPFSIIDDLNQGTLRKESMDAVEAVYPKLYNEMKNRVLTAIQDTDVSYQKRLKLSLLLGLPLGNETSSEGIKLLQSNFLAENQQELPKVTDLNTTPTDTASVFTKLSTEKTT